MLSKSVREAFISFTKENNSKYNNDIKDISHYRQQKEQRLNEAKSRSKFLSAEYRRYKSVDMFTAQLRSSVRMMPLIIFVGITFVVAICNILSNISVAIETVLNVALK